MGKVKEVVCDSSALISLTEACMLPALEFVHESFGLVFVITEGVFYEAIGHPLHMKQPMYRLSALKILELLEKGMLRQHTRSKSTIELTQELLEYGNNMFFMRGKPVKLVHEGEMEMLALAIAEDVPYVLMDERTTRLMVESPMSIKRHLEEEFRINVMVNKRNLKAFEDLVENITVVRSVELLALAYERGYFNKFRRKEEMFEAALYKMKYSGCAVSEDEIARLVNKLCRR